MSQQNHPIQPQAPKHQAGARKIGKSKSVHNCDANKAALPIMTVKEELLQRQRIEQRIAEKMEKRYESLEQERQARKQRRQASEVVLSVPRNEPSARAAEGAQ